jgi:hypothetical protein
MKINLNQNQKVIIETPTPITGEERLRIWKKVQGMWKNRKPDPIKELKKMRKEWDRKLPLLHIKSK